MILKTSIVFIYINIIIQIDFVFLHIMQYMMNKEMVKI